MPRFEDGCHSCANTSELISKILAGKGEMKYTRAAVGSGIIPEGQSPSTLTEPPGYVMDGVLASVGNPVAGECQVQVQVPSSMVDTSFKCTGLMLYALDPETEEEVPYTYLCLETESEEIRSRSNAVGKIAVFDLITVVGDIKNVSAVIDPNAMATHASVEAMFAQKLYRRDITIPTDGWVLAENAPTVTAPPVAALADDAEEGTEPEQPSVLYCVDIPVADITENCMADLKITRADSQAAAVCGLSLQCESLEGALRLYAATPPEKAISGQLALIELSRRNGSGRMLGTVSIAYTDASNIIYKGRPISVLLAGLEDLAETSRAITAVPTQLKVETYDGIEKTLQLNGFDGAAMILSGVTAATEAGWYEAVVTPKTGYYWMADGTATSRIIRWRIAGIPVPVPTQDGTLTYTGSPQSPAWAGTEDVGEGIITYSGETEATNAGTYAATASLATNYEWEDGAQGNRVIEWTIGKAPGSLTLNKTSLALNIASLSGYIGVVRAGSGQIAARSSNTNIASVAVSGEQITVTGKTKGTVTITVSVSEDSNHFAPPEKTCSVTVSIPSADPSQNTPAENQQLIQSGQAQNYWKIGDAMATSINGTVAGQALNLANLKTIILDFDYQKSRISGGKSNVIYGLAWKDASGNDIALCDANIHGTVPKNGNGFCMNPGDSSNNYGGNANGWKGSYMRSTVMAQLLNAVPADLRNIITAATIYTDNQGNSNNNTASAVTATSDKLWLPNEMEVFGSISHGNSNESNYTSQFAYFKNGNSRIAKNASSVSQAVHWWLRSAARSSSGTFVIVNSGGGVTSSGAYGGYGVRACFMVA